MAGNDPLKFNKLTDLSLIEFLNFYAITVEMKEEMVNRIKGKPDFENRVIAILNELLR